MKKTFSTKWKKSKQPRKQRKYRYNAPLHIRSKFLTVHLSKDLAKKHTIKRIRVKTGDKVKVMRGKFKGKEGKVEMVDLKKSRVVITGIEVSKKEGSKSKIPIHASNLLITEIILDDKKRAKKKTEEKTSESPKTKSLGAKDESLSASAKQKKTPTSKEKTKPAETRLKETIPGETKTISQPNNQKSNKQEG